MVKEEHRAAAVSPCIRLAAVIGSSIAHRCSSHRMLCADAWRSAGRTATPNLFAQNVAFERVLVR